MPKRFPIFRILPTLFPLHALVCLFLTLGSPQNLAAAETPGYIFTLSESIALALEKSPSLNSAELNIQAAILDRQKALKDFLPSLSATYAYTRLDDEPDETWYRLQNVTISGTTIPVITGTTQIETGTRDNWLAKLSLRQPIFTGFKLSTALELAKIGVDTAKIEREHEEADIIFDVNAAYFEILQAEKTAEVAKQAIKQVEAHLNMASQFFKAGIVTKNQVLETETRLAENIQAGIKADNAVLTAHAAFNTILRRPLDAPVRVQDILAYKPFTLDFEACHETALNKRPELRIIAQQINAAGKKISLSAAAYYPSIGLTANHYWKGDTFKVNGSKYIDEPDSWDVGVALVWNFWDWGKTGDDVRKSQMELARTRNAFSQIEDRIGMEVKKNYLAMQEAEKNIPVAQKAIEAAEENHHVSEARYTVQLATSFEVIDAVTLLASARRSYYEALYRYNLAWAALERAMGLGRDAH